MTETSLGDVQRYLEYVATNSNIAIEYSTELTSQTPDFAITKINSIVMNLNYDTNISIVFRLAHELSHLLFGDRSSQALYHFSPLCVNFEERIAHHEGIRMIAKFVYNETPLEYRNYVDFMDILGLPTSFENIVIEEIEDI